MVVTLEKNRVPESDLSTYGLVATSDDSGTWTQNASDTIIPSTQSGITDSFDSNQGLGKGRLLDQH